MAIYQSVRNGDVAQAMELQNHFLNFVEHGWRFGMTAVFEYIMKERGLAARTFRRPRAELDESLRPRLRKEVLPELETIERHVSQIESRRAEQLH